MNTRIDDRMLRHLEELSQLELTVEERHRVKEDLNRMLNYMENIQRITPEEIRPTTDSYSESSPLREDVVETERDGRKILGNAPRVENNQFVVPRTVE